jgi:hypothetical protein
VNFPLANGKYGKPAYKLVAVLGFMALAIWLFHFCLWYQYAATRPCRPDTASGRIYPLNTHGSVAYLNKDEDARLTDLTILAITLFTITFLIHCLFVDGFRLSQRTKPWEKKQW